MDKRELGREAFIRCGGLRVGSCSRVEQAVVLRWMS